MIARRRQLRAAFVPVALALLVAGCGGGDEAPSKDDSGSSKVAAAEPVESVLSIEGKVLGEPGASTILATTAADADEQRNRTSRVIVEEWPALELNSDGTIDAGPDPFLGDAVPVQAIPIEDDPATTRAIDDVAQQLRRVDIDRWNDWMNAGIRSPWQQETADTTAASIVEVTVERCGGARTVATGVVLADQTVVTSAHVVESAAQRVWVSSAAGTGSDEPPRIPAMIRFLDVDDDIAVLRVPGLGIQPLGWHVPVGTAPQLAYAYGVAPVGRAGTLRRAPVITSLQESSISIEQPDGFAQQISDRSVQTIVGGITSGFSGGVIAATNDEFLRDGWGFHGIIRARVPFRADTAGIVVPSRLVGEALDAEAGLEEWFEIRPGGCPQWRR
jgi:hypothetical protein